MLFKQKPSIFFNRIKLEKCTPPLDDDNVDYTAELEIDLKEAVVAMTGSFLSPDHLLLLIWAKGSAAKNGNPLIDRIRSSPVYAPIGDSIGLSNILF
jgi:hypothetical protein